MSLADFTELYKAVRNISPDGKELMRLNKDKLCDILCKSLKVNECAERVISLQSDTVIKTNAELLKMCADMRNMGSNENCLKASQDVRKSKTPSIVLKPIDQNNIEKLDDVNGLLKQALESIPVSNTNVTENGTIFINVPSAENHKAACDSLQSTFSHSFTIGAPKENIPKVLITNVPDNITESSFIDLLCAKDDCFSDFVRDEEIFQVEKSWKPKRMPENSGTLNFLLKCSRKVRNYIMEVKHGYVYLDLFRCKAHDYVNPIQCFHCQRYQHVAASCPDKNRPPICGNCCGFHKSKECNTLVKNAKCINCMRHKKNDVFHTARSSKCPFFVQNKKTLLSRMNFAPTSNIPKN